MPCLLEQAHRPKSSTEQRTGLVVVLMVLVQQVVRQSGVGE